MLLTRRKSNNRPFVGVVHIASGGVAGIQMERQNSEYNGTLTRTGEPSSRLYYHKVCLVGELGVGKTSFLLRIRTGEFQEECDYPSSGNLIGPGLTIASDTEKFVRKTFDGKDFGVS